MIVQSFGAFKSIAQQQRSYVSNTPAASLNLYGFSQVYFQIYKSQPNVRICVDFLARNIAQLGLVTYRRLSDTDRIRLNDHELAQWLKAPNPEKTRYRLIEDLVTDLGIYYRAYLLKVRYIGADGRKAIGLVRIPPDEMSVEGALLPTDFVWTVNGRQKRFPPSEIVHFSGYDLGISPLETLRNILAEEAAASAYREQFWTNGARVEGIWERHHESKRWTPEQSKDWRRQWQEYANTAKAGMTAVGEPGMTYKEVSHNAKDSEYTAGGKLRREVCAAAYHIPQPMVGILEHATFSNIRAQHEHLYQDCLGPWNEMITQEIERQLIPECEDQEGVYVEFNIDAKLAGTPMDRATSLQISIGRPWRTVNEGRALDNLPRIDDPEFDRPAPQQGGPSDASASPSQPTRQDNTDEEAEAAIHSARLRFQSRLQKLELESRVTAFELSRDRWMREVTADLAPLLGDQAEARAHEAFTRFRSQLEGAADA